MAVAIVVPCYNEERRFDAGAFERFLERAEEEVHFLFVDDGSTDGTAAALGRLIERHPAACRVLRLPENVGKAEAVRSGMLAAFAESYSSVGFWDADLATPLDAIPRLDALLRERPDLYMVFGSRVRLLGREIHRSPARHYLGRMFATAVSLLLRLPVYDTQCGAKIFRAVPEVEGLFRQPFLSKWIFDVEIIARLIHSLGPDGASLAAERIYEYPLHEWHGVAGSKLRSRDFLAATVELTRIYRRYVAG